MKRRELLQALLGLPLAGKLAKANSRNQVMNVPRRFCMSSLPPRLFRVGDAIDSVEPFFSNPEHFGIIPGTVYTEAELEDVTTCLTAIPWREKICVGVTLRFEQRIQGYHQHAKARAEMTKQLMCSRWIVTQVTNLDSGVTGFTGFMG